MCLPDDYCFNLQINIDGLPLFKSTQHQFWPILGSLRNIENREPFIIGLLFGLKKPDNVSDFLQRFLDEYLELRDNGIEVGGKTLRIKLHSVICDTLARAFVKCVKLYSGYYGCDKCTQSGRWCGEMTYPETDAPLRTDESFIDILNDGHQTGRPPLFRDRCSSGFMCSKERSARSCKPVNNLLIIWPCHRLSTSYVLKQ